MIAKALALIPQADSYSYDQRMNLRECSDAATRMVSQVEFHSTFVDDSHYARFPARFFGSKANIFGAKEDDVAQRTFYDVVLASKENIATVYFDIGPKERLEMGREIKGYDGEAQRDIAVHFKDAVPIALEHGTCTYSIIKDGDTFKLGKSKQSPQAFDDSSFVDALKALESEHHASTGQTRNLGYLKPFEERYVSAENERTTAYKAVQTLEQQRDNAIQRCGHLRFDRLTADDTFNLVRTIDTYLDAQEAIVGNGQKYTAQSRQERLDLKGTAYTQSSKWGLF